MFRKQLEVNARRLKVGTDKAEKDDILAGLTAVVTVRLAEPQFEGQTKEVLGTNAVRAIVARGRRAGADRPADLDQARRQAAGGPAAREGRLGDEVAHQRAAAQGDPAAQERARELDAAGEAARLPHPRRRAVRAVHRRGRLGDGHRQGGPQLGVPGAAADPRQDPQRPEGVGRRHAKNAECASIIQVIGAGSGRSFDLDSARYGKVIIMTDADVDGAHIRTLLLTLFFRYMRPLVDAGRVYAAMPPLHRIEVINAGGKKNDYIYTYNEPEMRRTVTRLERSGKKVKQPMQRYKGLGEMDADQLADTTMDPRHRTLRKVTMRDLEAAERTFELLMGNDVAPRKDFIIGSAAEVDRERIDA